MAAANNGYMSSFPVRCFAIIFLMVCFCLSILKLLLFDELIIFHWLLIALRMNWMASPVNATSLSIYRKIYEAKNAYTSVIQCITMTLAARVLIGIARTQLVTLQVANSRSLKSSKPSDMNFMSIDKLSSSWGVNLYDRW